MELDGHQVDIAVLVERDYAWNEDGADEGFRQFSIKNVFLKRQKEKKLQYLSESLSLIDTCWILKTPKCLDLLQGGDN